MVKLLGDYLLSELEHAREAIVWSCDHSSDTPHQFIEYEPTLECAIACCEEIINHRVVYGEEDDDVEKAPEHVAFHINRRLRLLRTFCKDRRANENTHIVIYRMYELEWYEFIHTENGQMTDFRYHNMADAPYGALRIMDDIHHKLVKVIRRSASVNFADMLSAPREKEIIGYNTHVSLPVPDDSTRIIIAQRCMSQGQCSTATKPMMREQYLRPMSHLTRSLLEMSGIVRPVDQSLIIESAYDYDASSDSDDGDDDADSDSD